MIKKHKNKFKPFYKKVLKLRENIQNQKKVLKFRKQKWNKFIEFYKRKLKWYKRFKLQNQKRYVVSKYPNRYTSYKNRYKNTLQAYKIFNLFYGSLSKKVLKDKIFFLKKKYINNINIKFIELFEKRLDVTLFRAKFSHSIRSAQQLIVHGKVLVNNKIVKSKSYVLKTGDLITINSGLKKLIEINIGQSNTWPLPPKHLIINYKTMQIIFGNIKYTNLSNLSQIYFNLEKVLINFSRH
jgi:ribosomal protein S4